MIGIWSLFLRYGAAKSKFQELLKKIRKFKHLPDLLPPLSPTFEKMVQARQWKTCRSVCTLQCEMHKHILGSINKIGGLGRAFILNKNSFNLF